MYSIVVLICCFLSACVVGASSDESISPRVTFAINAQLPPVAYADQPYELVFSPDTFTFEPGSPLSGIEYTLLNNPAWLAIDSPNRRLFGTPHQDDVGAVKMQLVATTDIGQTSLDVVLVILQNRTLIAAGDVLPHLATAGQTSTPAALLLKPSESFSFTIPPDGFDGVSAGTQFYAITSDGAPLPPWIGFDPRPLAFSGAAPPLTATIPAQQTYNLKLVASNVEGFSEAFLPFQVVVTTRILAFTPPRLTVNAIKGYTMRVPSLMARLTLDDKVVQHSDLRSVVSTAPPWLSFNESDLSLDGVIPQDAENLAFTVSVTGWDNDATNMTVLLQVDGSGSGVDTSLGVWNASVGKYFSHTFERLLGFDDNGRVVADLGQTSGWLSFEMSNLTLSGTVPIHQRLGQYNITIMFFSAAQISSNTIVINVTSVSDAPGIDTSTSSPTNLGPAVPTSDSPMMPETWSPKGKLELGLKIGLPLLVVIVLITLIICVRQWRQRRQRKGPSLDNENQDPTGDKSSNLPDQATRPGAIDPSIRKVSGEEVPFDAPQLELPWASDSLPKTKHRQSRKRKLEDSEVWASSWDDLISPSLLGTDDIVTVLPTIVSPRQRCSVPGRMHTGMSHSQRRRTRPDSKTRLHSFRVSQISSSFSSRGTELAPRLSGAGHGAGVNTAFPIQDLRSSWYTTFGSMPLEGSRPPTVILNAFPIPPSRSDGTSLARQVVEHANLRLVDDASNSTDPFEVARQRYYAERARDQLEGTGRFASQTNTPPRSRALAMLNSPAQRLSTRANVDLKQSLSSSWSFGSPPARTSQAVSRTLLQHQLSVGSSGQFDSALSSDSQWEDEELVTDENVAEERIRRSTSRPPFELYDAGTALESADSPRPVGVAHKRRRTADQQMEIRQVATELQRSESSQHDSLRFV